MIHKKEKKKRTTHTHIHTENTEIKSQSVKQTENIMLPSKAGNTVIFQLL